MKIKCFLPRWKKIILSFNQRGQLVVEYVLLLSMAAIVAAIVVSKLGSRNPDEPGAIIKGWSAIIKSVGDDKADSCFNPNCR